MQKLIFRTIKDGDKTYCGVKSNGKHLAHRFAGERNRHGHDPGYIYLVYLPSGPYKGNYHIGKVEFTTIGRDDFDLDNIHFDLLRELQRRINQYHPAKTKTDEKYDGAQFVHGIRVACGEGAEKQPHDFFRLKKLPGGEVFDLDEKDINIFKQAEGSMFGHAIKHLSAEMFASYLASHGMPSGIIRQLVLLPNGETISQDDEILIQPKTREHRTSNAGRPPVNAKPESVKGTKGDCWYTVDSVQGVELPTFFLRCIHSLRNHGTVNVELREHIKAEDKIFQFKHHWRYQDYTETYHVSPTEWENIFEAIRSAEAREKHF